MGVFWANRSASSSNSTRAGGLRPRRVWHESQQVRELPDGRSHVLQSERLGAAQWLLGFGRRAVVARRRSRPAARGIQARLRVYEPGLRSSARAGDPGPPLPLSRLSAGRAS